MRSQARQQAFDGRINGSRDSHLAARPLHLLGYVQARVKNELVQVSHLFGEARLAIAALLGGAELILEQGIVLGADNGKVVAHFAAAPTIGRMRGAQLVRQSVFAVS